MKPYYQSGGITIYHGDCREVLATLPDGSVNCCVTSPPFWGLRDYGHEDQLGLEKTPDEYVATMVAVFREVRRVLRDDGTLWLNLGDKYAGDPKKGASGDGKNSAYLGDREATKQTRALIPNGLKSKDLIGIPWMVAFALRTDGWYLRNDIIWNKPNPMPESVTDRCTKSHEYIFLLSKSVRYFYDADAIAEPLAECNAQRTTANYDTSHRAPTDGGNRGLDDLAARMRSGEATTHNKRSVWTVNTKPNKNAHFATFPPELITPCVLAGCPAGGTVLDPFGGSGTTAQVAKYNGRKSVLIELNSDYLPMIESRVSQGVLEFSE